MTTVCDHKTMLVFYVLSVAAKQVGSNRTWRVAA
jgi:hypothetical protein